MRPKQNNAKKGKKGGKRGGGGGASGVEKVQAKVTVVKMGRNLLNRARGQPEEVRSLLLEQNSNILVTPTKAVAARRSPRKAVKIPTPREVGFSFVNENHEPSEDEEEQQLLRDELNEERDELNEEEREELAEERAWDNANADASDAVQTLLDSEERAERNGATSSWVIPAAAVGEEESRTIENNIGLGAASGRGNYSWRPDTPDNLLNSTALDVLNPLSPYVIPVITISDDDTAPMEAAGSLPKAAGSLPNQESTSGGKKTPERTSISTASDEEENTEEVKQPVATNGSSRKQGNRPSGRRQENDGVLSSEPSESPHTADVKVTKRLETRRLPTNQESSSGSDRDSDNVSNNPPVLELPPLHVRETFPISSEEEELDDELTEEERVDHHQYDAEQLVKMLAQQEDSLRVKSDQSELDKINQKKVERAKEGAVSLWNNKKEERDSLVKRVVKRVVKKVREAKAKYSEELATNKVKKSDSNSAPFWTQWARKRNPAKATAVDAPARIIRVPKPSRVTTEDRSSSASSSTNGRTENLRINHQPSIGSRMPSQGYDAPSMSQPSMLQDYNRRMPPQRYEAPSMSQPPMLQDYNRQMQAQREVEQGARRKPRKNVCAQPSSTSSSVRLNSSSTSDANIEMAVEAREDEVDGARSQGLLNRAMSSMFRIPVPYGTIGGDEDSSRNGRGSTNQAAAAASSSYQQLSSGNGGESSELPRLRRVDDKKSSEKTNNKEKNCSVSWTSSRS